MAPSKPDFEAARNYARMRLANELSFQYGYHSLAHTQDEVVRKAEQLALLEDLSEHDLLLLKTAAWFHDIGFVEQSDGHENIAVSIVRSVLPEMGYDASDIERITEMIMATRLPQSPRSHAGKILADADLDVLGRPDFIQRNRLLREELEASGKFYTDGEWYRSQLQFLKSHRYFTASAERLNGAGKARNIAAFSALLAQP